ncbi:hypothetical protein CAI21_12155 [Alkalilimnicola ehrlichii]|uniref:Maltoporin n=1 Tax=Alkalilimnicola ehrlichii TaxID=351052 RepID=A0A3E0WUZ1_9GAMM|nr:carbohydrate porin [Alkalilimnicola ehrlichii]RFA28603.1 hypothetical protein CAI21_12155 [Alkalilimnicola ehrlichii]RFA35767.1 hypothetical protein CAL65_12675 [Alkalilimnicola ehrlichii]
MKRQLIKGAAALSSAVCLSQALAVEVGDFAFHGYMRAGTGINLEGGRQVCFQAPGADTKWRLGNECDYVIEPSFIGRVASVENGGEWFVHVMPSVYRSWDDDDELVSTFGQAFVYGENIPQLANGSVWAGRRFYDRVQLGINDQFLENHDGDGGGIENVDLGFAAFSYAFLMRPQQNANDAAYQHALRLTDIPSVLGSHFNVYAGYHNRTASSDQSYAPPSEPVGVDSLKRIGIYHITPDTLGGSTFLGFRYEEGNNDERGELTQWRVVLQQEGFVDAFSTGWSLIAQYRSKEENNLEEEWYSAGIRTDTHLSGPFRFLLEVGHDVVKPENQRRREMSKITLATAVSGGPDPWSRPTVRLFYTYAHWNSATRDNLSGALEQVYGNSTNGSTVGIQGEVWW